MNRFSRPEPVNSGGKQSLDAALEIMQREAPDRLCRAIRWLRRPEARRIRIPLGLVFIAASFFWYLPVVGIEFLPLGLLLIAIDVPVLQKPVGRATLWLERQWLRLKAAWLRRFPRHAAHGARRTCSSRSAPDVQHSHRDGSAR